MSKDYASAVEKARQLAAKYTASNIASGAVINVAGVGTSMASKRFANDNTYSDEDEEDICPAPKKPQSMQAGMQINDKVVQAAAIAAQLSQKISNPGMLVESLQMPNVQYGGVINNNSSAVMLQGGATAVLHTIPDNCVGLVIGKGGEQIMRIQADSCCKVQIAPDSGGLSSRQVTLTGTMTQINLAKAAIDDIVNKAGPGHFASNFRGGGIQPYQEIMVPGPKVGLIIGKNGETIKKMQEELNVKMLMIQETNQTTSSDKPLRISGDLGNVEKAKQMVMDLLNSRDNARPIGSYGSFQNGVRDGHKQQTTYSVPADKTGLIIGKGGETIKEICRLSGAYVGIQKHGLQDPNFKVFDVSGQPEQIEDAIRLICEKAGLPVPSSNQRTGTQTCNQQQQAVSCTSSAAPVINPVTGQPDYSAAWVEYYIKMGMPEQAQAIMRQSGLAAASLNTGQQMQSGQQQVQPGAGMIVPQIVVSSDIGASLYGVQQQVGGQQAFQQAGGHWLQAQQYGQPHIQQQGQWQLQQIQQPQQWEVWSQGAGMTGDSI